MPSGGIGKMNMTDKQRLDHIEKTGMQENMLPGCLQILWNGKGKNLREAIDTDIKNTEKNKDKK